MAKPTTRSPNLKLIPRCRDTADSSADLGDLLNRVRTLCEELAEGFADFRTRVAELEERLAEGCFQLAVLGQFKRGKSTLLNALLGEPLLPAGVVPLTSIFTFLRAGVETLVSHNVENLRWATLRNLADAFRRFSSTLDDRLKETAEATRRAMRATHIRQKQNEETAQPDLERLNQKAAELADLENTLS